MLILTRVSKTGPLFNGLAKRAAREFTREASLAIAQEGQSMWIAQLNKSMKNPTGYYTSNIMINRAGNSNTVHDNDVIYGPWLEGTGSRNRTTRFKGYHSMRKVNQRLDRKASTIAERVLRRYLPRMN